MHLVTRTETFAKLFFLLSFSGLLMYIVLAFNSFHTAFITTKTENAEEESRGPNFRRFDKDLIFILLWTIPELAYNLTTDGQQLFIDNNCLFNNCFLTTNKDMLDKDVKNFDAILFSINILKNWKVNMPKSRSPKQRYVFYSMTSADTLPVCNIKADGFFNWTWSYKLHSDIVTPFIEVRDLTGKIIAPKYTTNFTDPMDTLEDRISEDISFNGDSDTNESLRVGSKTKAMMWYISRCDINENTMMFIRQLQEAMKESALTFDIYGCKFKKCPKEGCFNSLARDYYFYLAQEESISEDYVTTEVLKGYHHNAVPVVVGGADYTKFLPAHSYIDANHESVERLVALLRYITQSPPVYRSYFTWRKRLTIQEMNLQKGYCQLCEKLNGKIETSVYKYFRKWWFYGSLNERCYPKGAERYDNVLSYIKSGRNEKP